MRQIIHERAKTPEVIAYASLGFGFPLLGALVTYYLNYFWTDIWKLPIGAMTIIIVIARLFDGFIDPAIGHHMDSRRNRYGKYRGYLRYWVLPFCISHVLLFTKMPFSESLSLIWCAAIYLLWSLSFSIVEGVSTSLLGAMSADTDQRKTINTLRIAASVGAFLVVSYLGMPVMKLLGGENSGRGIFFTMVIMSAVGLFTMLPTSFLVKERNLISNTAPGYLDSIKSMVKNPALIAMTVFYLLEQCVTALRSPMTLYYVNYYLGREDLFPIIAVISIIFSLLGQPVILWLSRRVDILRIIIVGTLLSGLSILMIGLAGRNLPWVMAFLCLYGVVSAFPANLIFVHAASLADRHSAAESASYGGIINSLLGFGSRIGSALGGALSVLMLAVTDYVPQASQSPSALMGIQAGFIFFPATFCFIGALIIWGFNRVDMSNPDTSHKKSSRL